MNKRELALLKENFNLCMDHYDCTSDEAKFEKARILANVEEAARCYSVIAAGIRNENHTKQNKET